MIYGREYVRPTDIECPVCGTDIPEDCEAQAICADGKCQEALLDCCIRTGGAKRCDGCREWHCAKHLSRTDCGELCQECKAEYVQESAPRTAA